MVATLRVRAPESLAAGILQDYAGLVPDGPHGQDTPKRFLSMLSELTECRQQGDPEQDALHMKECIKWRTFGAESDDMVIVHDIGFVSLCNHHVVPFIGKAYIGYVPGDLIVGLS